MLDLNTDEFPMTGELEILLNKYYSQLCSKLMSAAKQSTITKIYFVQICLSSSLICFISPSLFNN